MSFELSPSLDELLNIHRAASDYLLAISEEGHVVGFNKLPSVFDHPVMDHSFISMHRLEKALNPRRLKHDDEHLRGTVVSFPYGERHCFALIRSLEQLRGGLDKLFQQWGTNAIWGCESCSFGGPTPIGLASGHVHFEIVWPPAKIERGIYDAMDYANNKLGECIKIAITAGDEEQQSQIRVKLEVNAAPPVAAVSAKASEGMKPTVGRPQESSPDDDRELLTAWEQAKGAGVQRKAFCRDRRITLKSLTQAQGRMRSRNNSASR